MIENEKAPGPQSHLPAKRTLDKLGIPRATFYRWYDRYRTGGPEALSDLITSPAYVVIKAANEFKDKTTAINQLWQTDFTYLCVPKTLSALMT